jgi:thiamine pyrophosphate-dependent acetolactate synthase large subunit-like protein
MRSRLSACFSKKGKFRDMATTLTEQKISDPPKTKVRGDVIIARALVQQGVKAGFFLLGGPMSDTEHACAEAGIRMIDVRHEQAAALMAQAYSRVLGTPGVCMGCSGPGAVNLTTGLANALIDCVPVVALGGSSPTGTLEKEAFQEIDQVAVMRPVTKWAGRCLEARRIPEYIDIAFREATSGRPGPVYLDFPREVLYDEVDEGDIRWPMSPKDRDMAKPAASADALEKVGAMLRAAERPIIMSGSGVLFAHAAAELEQFVDLTGIPFYTTPQGRGAVPEDHKYNYGRTRSTALKEADLVLVIGTRLNYVIAHVRPPRFARSAKVIRIDVDPTEIARSQHVNLGIVGDAKTVLTQLNTSLKGFASDKYAAWRERLGKLDRERQPATEAKLNTDQMPIQVLRLCKEIRDFIDRDAILVVDGRETLTYGRQNLPSFLPGHRLNSGPFGMMGVGMPFAVGAKVAKPDKQVLCLHGDGSFAMNGFELDTAVRHNLPLIVVISLNGGWGAASMGKTGRNLGYTRFEKFAEMLGCYGEYVEKPEDIRPALERAKAAVAKGQCALINVVTDATSRAEEANRGDFDV